jgi:hypothetical protein
MPAGHRWFRKENDAFRLDGAALLRELGRDFLPALSNFSVMEAAPAQ